MKLIRRRKSKTPAQKALDAVRLGVRGLVVARMARSAFKTYRFARRLPVLLGGAAIAVLVARKLRGGSDSTAEPVPYEPPPPAAPRPAAAAEPAPEPASPPAPAQPETTTEATPTAEAAGDGAPSPAALAESGGEMPTSPDLDAEAPTEDTADEAEKKAG